MSGDSAKLLDVLEARDKTGPEAAMALPKRVPAPTAELDLTYRDPSIYTGIDWVSLVFILVPHLVALWGLFYVARRAPTLIFAFFCHVLFGLSITAGYHRMWSHRAFKGAWPLRLVFALCGAGALEGSAKWWCRHHRAHHRYADTSKDPYNVRKGLLWSHFGWMIFKRDRRTVGQANITDLMQDKILAWQSRNYIWLAILFGFVLPTAIPALFWGDFWGGLVYATICRAMFLHHNTFSVNSLAHWLGDQPFSHFQSAMDSWITALVSFGEGYHNFHHAFSQDYRNALKWFQYDPTKWMIYLCSKVGLAYDLHRTPANEIIKSELQAEARALALQEAQHRCDAMLPLWIQKEVSAKVEAGESLLILNGYVVDVSPLLSREHGSHPGGRRLLLKYLGRDATEAFCGGHGHIHTAKAQRLMEAYRVARFAYVVTEGSADSKLATTE